MLKIDPYPSETAEKRVNRIVRRGLSFKHKEMIVVQRILEDVRKRGDSALIEYSQKYDSPGMKADQFRVTPKEMANAAKKVDRSFVKALNRAADQIAAFHRQQKPRSWIDTPRPGTMLGQLVRPVEVAGVYVPGGQGGQTPLVSSVLMGAIPAKIAGVEQIVMVTPPQADGSVSPHLLAAARKAGVDMVFKVGSAWAIAAMAYGTQTIPKVDVIVGPGNIYVTLAKKLVAGTVQIDMIAGPSEILVIADDSADPAYVAADMLSQAEHDPLAAAMLITDSEPIARGVKKALADQLASLARESIARRSLTSFGALFLVADMPAAIQMANRIAPEHLELHVKDPFNLIGGIRHAGAIFVGAHTPEPVGDYVAGPNHVLPTAGTARFSSALSVDHFIKKTSLIHYSGDALRQEATDIMRLARIEGLAAHARSVQIRLER
jgi:histidinol dehydrogenase